MYIAVTENSFILSWIDKERLSMLETLIDHFQGLFLSLSLILLTGLAHYLSSFISVLGVGPFGSCRLFECQSSLN